MKTIVAGVSMMIFTSTSFAADFCKDKAKLVGEQVGRLSSGSGELIRNDLIAENNDYVTYRVWTRDNLNNPTTGEEYRITLTKEACRVFKLQQE